MENIKVTMLHERHQKLGAKMSPFAGFDMPIEYAGITQEHAAVRHKAGLFDVSHMGEIRIKGPDAMAFVDYIGTNRITGVEFGRVMYTILCTPEGGVIDDLFIYKLDDNEILLVVNASNIDVDYAWFLENKKNFDVEITNESDDWGEIALQGPLSASVLEPILKKPLNELYFMRFKVIEYERKNIILSRSGYTGEDGFELYGKTKIIAQLWDKILENHEVSPCGLGCRDTLRFEAGLPLYGHEMSRSISPLEAGSGFAVKLDKNFIGRDALQKQKDLGLPHTLVGLELIDKGIARGGYEVYKNGEKIGVVTTGYLLPGREHALALALLTTKDAALDSIVDIQIRGKNVAAKVRDFAFFHKNYYRKTL